MRPGQAGAHHTATEPPAHRRFLPFRADLRAERFGALRRADFRAGVLLAAFFGAFFAVFLAAFFAAVFGAFFAAFFGPGLADFASLLPAACVDALRAGGCAGFLAAAFAGRLRGLADTVPGAGSGMSKRGTGAGIAASPSREPYWKSKDPSLITIGILPRSGGKRGCG